MWNLFFRRNIASLASMQRADDNGSDGEEGQAFYAGGSERRWGVLWNATGYSSLALVNKSVGNTLYETDLQRIRGSSVQGDKCNYHDSLYM